MKRYLVVGGTHGIGHEVALQLNSRGEVHVTGRSKVDDEIIYHSFDACDESSRLDLEVESLDGLVYCPGTVNLKPFTQLKDEDFLLDFQINCLGAVRVIREALPLLQKSDMSSIVLFSTVAVGRGMPYHASVASAKGAVEGLIRSLAAEYAPNIRVNGVAPSLTDTQLVHHLLSNDQKREGAAKRHPLQTVGDPASIARAVVYLVTEESSWVTGQVLGVDGGLSTLSLF